MALRWLEGTSRESKQNSKLTAPLNCIEESRSGCQSTTNDLFWTILNHGGKVYKVFYLGVIVMWTMFAVAHQLKKTVYTYLQIRQKLIAGTRTDVYFRQKTLSSLKLGLYTVEVLNTLKDAT